MFSHFLTTAYRNLLKQKSYSLINIGGLAMGLAACILIFLFVRDEVSYDQFWTDRDQLFRVEGAWLGGDGGWSESSVTPGRTIPAIAEQYPEQVEAWVRLNREGNVIKRGSEVFIETVIKADKGLFDVFDMPMVAGNREDVFKDNVSVIIDEDIAKKYFGAENPIGQTLELDDEDYDYTVVAVMKNLPENTHLQISMISWLDPERYKDRPWVIENWLSSNTHNYVKLKNPSDGAFLEAQMPDFLDRNVVAQNGGEMIGKPHERLRMNYVPVKDIHLYSQRKFQTKPPGDILIVYSFSAIAILILVIASINFVNLATAKASMRAREIALKKTLGAKRKQLIVQFLAETAFTVFLAMLLAAILVQLILPYFNDFIQKEMRFDLFSDPLMMVGLLVMFVLVALGAGIHPAMQISLFRPAEVLKSNKSSVNDNSRLRVILVTLQFAVSIALIITTSIVYFQTDYAKNRDMGFETANRLFIKNMTYESIRPVAMTIQNEINALPGVKGTAFSQRGVPIQGFWSGPAKLIGRGADETITLEPIRADYDYLSFMGARLLAGRLFSRDFSGDAYQYGLEGEVSRRGSVVLNEAAAQKLGYSNYQEAIGQSFRFNDFDNSVTENIIVGIIENMHLRSMREKIETMAFSLSDNPANYQFLNVEIDPNMQKETLLQMEQIWKRHVPSFPLRYEFIDDSLGRLYEADSQRGQMFAYFAIFAVLVSCLGLFGLASFAADRKTKEIGLRKVHGAGIFSIIQLMLWQFSKPILVANTLAWPVAWYYMSDWLSGFQYRIDLNALPFVGAALIALIIAWGTVTLHTYRVARMNPINSLRYE